MCVQVNYKCSILIENKKTEAIVHVTMLLYK